MPDIRIAEEKDKPRIREIWDYCFSDTPEFVSLYFDAKFNPSDTLTAWDNDVMVADLQMLPYQINLHGRPLDTSYIVGAATMPEARGKNCMKLLLEKSLKLMRDKGQIITILLPFNYGFYRKYGWETCYYQKVYSLEMADIKAIGTKYGRMRPFSGETDLQKLMDVYAEFNLDKNGYMIRTKQDWNCILKDHATEGGKVYLLEDSGGGTCGYILYALHQKTFAIHEAAYVSNEALKGLLGFAYAHSAQANRFSWKAPWNDLTFLELADPKGEVTLKPFVMARVIHTQAMLELLCSAATEPFDFTIEVADTFVEDNNGIFQVQNCNVTKIETAQADLTCSINTFTQMAMGFITPLQAYESGFLSGIHRDAVRQAQQVIKPSINYINDYY